MEPKPICVIGKNRQGLAPSGWHLCRVSDKYKIRGETLDMPRTRMLIAAQGRS
jgi:hypothetical protein